MSGLMFPKPRPLALDRAAKKAAQATADQRGSEEARRRAAGHCEIVVIGEGRCSRTDHDGTHHMIGGRLRGKGESAKAIRKQRVCTKVPSPHHRACAWCGWVEWCRTGRVSTGD